MRKLTHLCGKTARATQSNTYIDDRMPNDKKPITNIRIFDIWALFPKKLWYLSDTSVLNGYTCDRDMAGRVCTIVTRWKAMLVITFYFRYSHRYDSLLIETRQIKWWCILNWHKHDHRRAAIVALLYWQNIVARPSVLPFGEVSRGKPTDNRI